MSPTVHNSPWDSCESFNENNNGFYLFNCVILLCFGTFVYVFDKYIPHTLHSPEDEIQFNFNSEHNMVSELSGFNTFVSFTFTFSSDTFSYLISISMHLQMFFIFLVMNKMYHLQTKKRRNNDNANSIS